MTAFSSFKTINKISIFIILFLSDLDKLLKHGKYSLGAWTKVPRKWREETIDYWVKMSGPGVGYFAVSCFPGSPTSHKSCRSHTVDHMPEPDGNSRSLKTLCVLAVGHGGLGRDWAAKKLLFWPVSQCQGPTTWAAGRQLALSFFPPVLVSHKLMSKAEGSYFVPHLKFFPRWSTCDAEGSLVIMISYIALLRPSPACSIMDFFLPLY